MPFVVTESCIQCTHTDCVDVCPMECFVEGPNFLAIDPAQCIDCSVCVPECPVGAIIHAAEASVAELVLVELNARLAGDPKWKPITRSKPPLPDHGTWSAVKNKLHLLQRPA